MLPLWSQVETTTCGYPARHSRDHRASYADGHGTSAFVWHRCSNRAGCREFHSSESRRALSRARSFGTEGLDQRNLATTENKREANYYTITRSGARALAEHSERWQRSAD